MMTGSATLTSLSSQWFVDGTDTVRLVHGFDARSSGARTTSVWAQQRGRDEGRSDAPAARWPALPAELVGITIRADTATTLVPARKQWQ